MKRIKIISLCFLIMGQCMSQFGYEEFYPESYWDAKFKQAATNTERINAAGELALFHMYLYRDSLSKIYLDSAYQTAAASQEPELIILAKWWDTYAHHESRTYDQLHYVTNAARDLLTYAERHNFPEYKIAAHNILSDINIHDDLKESENHAILAGLYIDEVPDDSLKIEVYYRLAHLFIHKKDYVSSSRYLLKMLTYAEQENNHSTRLQAQDKMAELCVEIEMPCNAW